MITATIAQIETQEALFRRLYEESFPAIARTIQKMGGDLEDSRDVFQEALVIYYEKTVIDQIQLTTNLTAYLRGISKNLYLKKQAKTPITQPLGGIELASPEDPRPSQQRLLRFLQSSGQKCLNILSSFYYEKLSMKEMAQRFGFASERSATVQKYKCLEKVRETIKEKSMDYADFLD